MSSTISKQQKRDKKKKLLRSKSIMEKQEESRKLNSLKTNTSKTLYEIYEKFTIKIIMEIGLAKSELPFALIERLRYLASELKCLPEVEVLFPHLTAANDLRNAYISSDNFKPDLLYIADLAFQSIFGNAIGKYFVAYELHNIQKIKSKEKRIEELNKIKRREIITTEVLISIINRVYNTESLKIYNDKIEQHKQQEPVVIPGETLTMETKNE